MKMRDGGDVPRVTSQGACQKAGSVIDKMGDDPLDDLLGEIGSRDLW